MKTLNEDSRFTVFLEGRIDTNNARQTEEEIFAAAGGFSGEIVLDAGGLAYISSAGLRVLMRLRKSVNSSIKITNTSSEVYEIFETTGFTELFEVSRRMRELSVEGCEIIGRGQFGTVYRTDPETIVKVYASPDSLPMIRNETELAKTALLAGVPTAIAYDIVRVGDSYGSVFELLNARTLNDLLTDNTDDADSVIRQYAEFLKLVNSQTVPAGKLRSARERSLGYLDTAAKYLDGGLERRLRQLISEVPEQLNVIHGDAQMKNIMVVDGEPMLIDMDTLSQGHPIFELQAVYVTYFAFGEDDPSNSMEFLGIPKAVSDRVWERFAGYYSGSGDEAVISSLKDKIALVGSVRFLYLIDMITDHGSELFKTRVDRTVKRLGELAERVESLAF